MKTTAFAPGVLDAAATASTAAGRTTAGFARALGQFVSGLRSATQARRMRTELAELDAHLLRDIGIAEDEIPRVHAQEAFVPRNWRA